MKTNNLNIPQFFWKGKMWSSLQFKLLLRALKGECSPSKMEEVFVCVLVSLCVCLPMCKCVGWWKSIMMSKRETSNIYFFKIPNGCLWQIAVFGFLSQSQGDRWHFTGSPISLREISEALVFISVVSCDNLQFTPFSKVTLHTVNSESVTWYLPFHLHCLSV